LAKGNKLERFGFSFGRNGAHTARTMMLKELQQLILYVGDDQADKAVYSKAILDDNCLGKRSVKTRQLTVRHLVELYSLDPACTLFRSLLFFWAKDTPSQPLLALLCTFARDPVFRISAPLILSTEQGQVVTRESMEILIDEKEPGRFSEATLKSTAQNINSTWTQSGHLSGVKEKIRFRADASPGAAAYALFLGYLTGARGEAIFTTEYAKLLDCPASKGMELAEEAARRGWIVFKKVGNVVEVVFPQLLTTEEQEWLREPD
jgi:hypothetical protein